MTVEEQIRADVNRRKVAKINAQGLAARVDDLAAELAKSIKTIESQQRTINQQAMELAGLKKDFIVFKFSTTGSGPTAL